ncbi:hypothetical protein BpHYR1_042242 [Brachionus plicatilis]|uniref:Uncharacterized protein n=1 Tax=Brachionus plicatilis TaxID=10195 RepID=A0A3M7PTK3_BRAPC|nr:hypothetical protein BpHYR1_042242 [Brachionus plicatilis]
MIKCSIKKVQNPKDKKLSFAKIIRLKNQIYSDIFSNTYQKIGWQDTGIPNKEHKYMFQYVKRVDRIDGPKGTNSELLDKP